jgi:dTDP-4-dehydrorhamnose reductase
VKILLFGKNGQVGWELNRSLQPLGEVIALGREDADFSNPESLRDIVRKIKPDIIVNAVAYTAVDKAEAEEDLAATINGVAPGILAEESLETGALLIHYSTDYVFDGTKTSPYLETDSPNPVNAYGRTKLAGEQVIVLSGCDYLIFRTSWVYAARGSNFGKTMLRLAKEKNLLKVVSDQHGAPTSAELIADITALALFYINRSQDGFSAYTGTYHLVSHGETTWFDYAKYVLEMARSRGAALRVAPEAVQPVTTEAYRLPAMRPKNSILNTAKLSNAFSLSLPDWKIQVKRLVDELVSHETL